MSGVSVEDLRERPEEWHRHGLLHPAALEALIHARLVANVPAEPAYSDFFVAPEPLGARPDRPAGGCSRYRRG